MRVLVAHQHRSRRFPGSETRRTVRCVVNGERKTVRTISVVFTDNRFLRRMNRAYLNRNRYTDVMAFPLGSVREREGEVYVSLDQARAQAGDLGLPVGEEVRRLIIHGTLHLLGDRDGTARQRIRMRMKEDHYLRLLRYTERRRRSARAWEKR